MKCLYNSWTQDVNKIAILAWLQDVNKTAILAWLKGELDKLTPDEFGETRMDITIFARKSVE